MKQKVKYSRFVMALTWATFVVLFVGCFLTIHEKRAFYILLLIYLILIIVAFIYGPVCINADKDNIKLVSILKSIKIPVRNIESVELFQPTMGAIRIFGSGGFMGYWGIFREGDIGRYYAFYGRSSDCFLVRMKNGDKYVLSCENPGAMVDYIESQLKQSNLS